MAPFFIASLPRTRSVWVSTLLTHGAVWCGHEVLSPHDGEMVVPEGVDHAGAIGSDVIVFESHLRLSHPGARMAVLVRSPVSVVASLRRCGIPARIADIRMLHDMALAVAEKWNAPVFHAKLLDSAIHVEALWEHCLPDVPFPAGRAERFADLNIQMTPRALHAQVRRGKEWAARMGVVA